MALNAASSLAWEESSPSPTLWATDFFGTYAAVSAATTNLSFANVERGHEEVCMNFIIDPPVGAVLSGAADVGGWVHDAGVSAWPTKTFAAADGWAHNCMVRRCSGVCVGGVQHLLHLAITPPAPPSSVPLSLLPSRPAA